MTLTCTDTGDMAVLRVPRPKWVSLSMVFVGSVISCSDGHLEGLATQQEPVVSISGDDRMLSGAPTIVYSVGRQEGEDWEILHSVRGVAFDDENKLYIVDGQHRVLVFDTTGQLVRQFGHEGDGPGEFRFPRHLAVTAQGHIVVDDARHRSWIVFDSDGRYLRAIPWRIFQAGTLTVDPSYGGLQGSPLGGVVSLSGGYPLADSTFSSVFRHSLDDGDTATELYTLSVTDYVSVTTGGGTVIRSPEYRAIPRFAMLPDGAVVVQHEYDYIVRIVDSAGRESFGIERPLQAREVTERDRREWQRREEQRLERIGLGDFPPVPYDVPFARFMSVVTGLRTDPTGHIWIRRRRDDGAEDGRIDIVGRLGNYIGTLENQRMPVAIGGSGFVAFHEVDQLGVERVVVRRLPASWYR